MASKLMRLLKGKSKSKLQTPAPGGKNELEGSGSSSPPREVVVNMQQLALSIRDLSESLFNSSTELEGLETQIIDLKLQIQRDESPGISEDGETPEELLQRLTARKTELTAEIRANEESKKSLEAELANLEHNVYGKPISEIPPKNQGIDSKEIEIASSFAELAPDLQQKYFEIAPSHLLESHFPALVAVIRYVEKRNVLTPEKFQDFKEKQKLKVEKRFEDPTKDSRPPIKFGRVLKPLEECTSNMKNINRNYKFLAKEGTGGFGKVYFAKSKKHGGQVAIKKMPLKTESDKKNAVKEVSFLRYLDHPCIVQFVDCHILPEEVWVVMEYLDGGTVHQAVTKTQFQEHLIAFVAEQVLSGLEYLHNNGVVHRDLKADNIMLTVYGETKIVDFGLAEDLDDHLKWPIAGSKYWMPPETIMQEEEGTPVDIWSLGITLLEMANGHPPNEEKGYKCLFMTASVGVLGETAGLEEPSRWSNNFKDFLTNCLQLDPKKRYTATKLLKHAWIREMVTDKCQEEMADLVQFCWTSTTTNDLQGGLF